jgi:hypothetical protein
VLELGVRAEYRRPHEADLPTGSRPNFIGETIYFELPYSKVRANAADLFWQTSWLTDYRTWIGPDIYAPPTFAAFSRNEDPALEAILGLREQFPGPQGTGWGAGGSGGAASAGGGLPGTG